MSSYSLPDIENLSEDDSGDERPVSRACQKSPRKAVLRRANLHNRSGSAWGAVEDLSDDSSSHEEDMRELGLPTKRKRKADGPSPGERLVSELHIKAMLSKQCKSCKRSCLSRFSTRKRGMFQQLVEFRQKWADMHKLDQDKVVPSHLFICFDSEHRFLLHR